MKIIIFLLLSYLMGAIPSGYLVTNWLKKIDLRKFGSGNVGATNVTRVIGIKYGLLVAGFDILKGFLPVIIARYFLSPDVSICIIFLIGITAIVGHSWSVFLKFSGGKGVATTVGVILAVFPQGLIIFILIWIGLVLLTRYVSLASITATVSLPFAAYFFHRGQFYIFFCLLLAIFVITTHRSNIRRLLTGRENKMNWPPDKRRNEL